MTAREILKAITEKISGEIKVLSTQDQTSDEITFVVDSFKWLRVGKILTSPTGETYRAETISTEQNGDKLIKARLREGTFPPDFTTLTVPEPVFFGGTIREINAETSEIKRSSEKTPMIYLEPTRNRRKNDKLNRIRYESPVRIFFLDEANFKEWISDDYFTELVDPLEPLLDAFVSELKYQSQLIDFDEYTSDPVTKFARFDSSGNLRKYFTDDLGGWSLSFDLRVINSENCPDPYRLRE